METKEATLSSIFEGVVVNARELISRGGGTFELNDFISNGDGTYTTVKVIVERVRKA